ncbi:hypothetical protein TNCV_2956651 [Trichonephila clavipes]|nr:hypothetical protein TNCV_2956651 [Trichonephila clavipes]
MLWGSGIVCATEIPIMYQAPPFSLGRGPDPLCAPLEIPIMYRLAPPFSLMTRYELNKIPEALGSLR